MSYSPHKLALLPGLLLWAMSSPADGQQIETIEEIQVTATRRAASIRDISAAITIVDSEKIRSAKLVTDALAAQPGVFLQQTTPGQGAAIIRGLKGSEVLHLVDGFRLNNAIFRNAPTQYMALVAPGGVQRIEVVRGAAASLYGSDAVGGVVQMVSRMPSFSEQGSRREMHLGYDTAELGKVLRASYDLGDEKLSGLISGEYLKTGNRRTGSGERIAPSGYESKGARLALKAQPSDENSWLFDFQYVSQPSTPRVDELVPGFGQTEPSSSEFYFEPNERTFAHLRHIRDDWIWSADWSFAIGWQKVTDDRRTRDYQSNFRRYEQNSSDLFGFTTNVAKNSAQGAWVIGAEFYTDEVRSQRSEEDITNGGLQELMPRFPDKSRVDQAAVFGNLQHYLGKRNRISAGLRFSAIQTDIPETAQDPAANVDQDDISLDFGWIYDLSDHTQLIANLGYGFRAPNVFDLGTLGNRPGNRFNIPNTNLESEKITQFDVGVRHRGDRLVLDVMLYTLHYKDKIVSALTGATTPSGRDVVQSQNIATSDIYGFEVALNLELSMALTANLVLNYQRGDQDSVNETSVPADRMPPFNGRLSLFYNVSDDWSIEPFLIFADGQDRLSPRDVQDVRIDPNGTAGWLTANLATTWNVSETLRVRAAIENIFDKQYRVHGSGLDSPGTNLIISANFLW